MTQPLINPYPKTLPRIFGDSDFYLSCIDINPQPDYPLHTHEYSELVIVWEGTAVHATEDEEYKIERGDVFLIKEEQAHGYKNCRNLYISDILFDWENLFIPLEDLRTTPGYHALFSLEPSLRYKHGFKSHLKLSKDQINEIKAIYSKLDKELHQKGPGFRFLSLSYLMQLIGFLARSYSTSEVPSVIELLQLSKVLTYVEIHFREKITLTKLAQKAALTERTLQRRFKKEFGMSPITYLNQYRLWQAKQYLKKTNDPITEIAYKCGFEDSNYFSKIFKEYYKLAPRDMRNHTS